MRSVYLREDRYAPENLLAIEKLRWEKVLEYQDNMKKNWKPIFSRAPEEGKFHGICHFYQNGVWSDRQVCFAISEYGIGNDYIREDDRYAEAFIRCLPDNKVPLYINSVFEKVKEAAKKRLAGQKRYEPIPLRQDLVDLYYKAQRKSGLLLKSIQICTQIIEHHSRNLAHKINRTERLSSVVSSLVLNDRVYIFQDNKILVSPEINNWIFNVDDLMNDSPVDESRLDRFKLTVRKEEG